MYEHGVLEELIFNSSQIWPIDVYTEILICMYFVNNLFGQQNKHFISILQELYVVVYLGKCFYLYSI